MKWQKIDGQPEQWKAGRFTVTRLKRGLWGVFDAKTYGTTMVGSLGEAKKVALVWSKLFPSKNSA